MAQGGRVGAAQTDAFIGVVEAVEQPTAQGLQLGIHLVSNSRDERVAAARRASETKLVVVAQQIRQARRRVGSEGVVLAKMTTGSSKGRPHRVLCLGVVQRAHHIVVPVHVPAQHAQAESVESSSKFVHHFGRQVVSASTVHAVDETSAQGDVSIDLPPGRVDILRHARHLKDGFLLPGRRDYVRARLLLDPFDGGALGAHDETNDSIRHADLCHTREKREGKKREVVKHQTD